MPKLNRSDLSAIYRACEIIAQNKQELFVEVICSPAYTDCTYFYGGHDWGNWSEDYDTRQNERIMALLFFAAAGGEL